MIEKGFALIILVVVLAAVFVVSGIFYLNQIKPPQSQSSPVVPQTPKPTPSVDPTANWKTYTNEKYAYEVKYPNDWKIVKELSRPEEVIFSSTYEIEGSPALVTIQVRKAADLSSDWKSSYKPYYAIDSKQKGDNIYIFIASSYEEGVGISQKREKLAITIYNQTLATFKFLDQTSTDNYSGGVGNRTGPIIPIGTTAPNLYSSPTVPQTPSIH